MAGHIVYAFAVSLDGYIGNAPRKEGEIGLPIPEET